MVHYSVLISERDATGAVSRLLPQLCRVLGNLVLPYEIICIDDASSDPAADKLEELLGEYAHLRVLRFDRPRGTSAALCAGLLAARGEFVIALDANTRFAPTYVPHLIARLSQHGLVVARHERSLVAELLEPLARLARLVAGSPRLEASEDLFWAAHRETLVGLSLPRGAFRALGELVAQRGYRVCNLTLAPGLPPQGAELRPNLVQRIVAGWLDRRFEPHLASELVSGDAFGPALQLSRVPYARARWVPQPAAMPAAVPVEKQRDSA